MGRKATGMVQVREGKGGRTYALRFRAYGQRRYLTLGREEDGWDERAARAELDRVLAAVKLGVWRGDDRGADAPRPVPTFLEFASEWFHRRRAEGGRRGTGLSANGEANLRWQLERHLLPYYGDFPLDRITVADVDQFRHRALTACRLSPASVNKLIQTLDAIMALAVEYEHTARNPAAGRNRRVRAERRRGSYLRRADHIAAVLDAAGQIDRRHSRGGFRALFATLVLAGTRIDEALSLRWRDVDLAAGRITVEGSKTDAGRRTVRMLPLLRDELAAHRAARAGDGPDVYVFRNARGGKENPSNVRNRQVREAVRLADEALADRGLPPLPTRLTPHSFRRTFASLLYALGEPQTAVMRQIGHSSAALTLEVYAAEMDEGEQERLRALVDGGASLAQLLGPLVQPESSRAT